MPPTSAPTSLIGQVDEHLWGSIFVDALETVPDLTWPLSVQTYRQMRYDPQLSAVLQAYMLPLRRASWTLDGAGCRTEVTALVADDLGLPVAGKDQPGAARTRGVSWPEHLRAALLELVYGHAGFELQAEVSTDQARLIGVWDRPQHTISQIHVDDKTGEFLGIAQDLVVQDWDKPQITADRMAWYCHEREGAGWQGRSLLRPAYGPWLIKREMQRVLGISNRRWGAGVPVMEAIAGTNPTPAQMAEAQRMASAARAGDQGGAATPPGFTMKILGLSGSVPDTLGFLRWLDQQMSRMALAGFLDLGETPNGSRALGESFVDLLLMSEQAIADQVADTATRQIAARIVDWNWGPDEPVPQVTVSGLGARRDVTAESLQLLLASGALAGDPELEAYVRREWRLPERKEPAPTPPPAKPGAGKVPEVQPAGETTAEPAAQPNNDTATRPAKRVTASRHHHPGQTVLDVVAAPERPQPPPNADPQQVRDEWQQAVEQLAEQWQEESGPLTEAVVASAVAAVVAAGIAGLVTLAVPRTPLVVLTRRVVDAAITLAGRGMTTAVQELARIGIQVGPRLGDDRRRRIRQVAEAGTAVLVNGAVNGATRAVLAQAGPDATSEQVGAIVGGHLDELGQARANGWVVGSLAGILTTAQAEGRRAAHDAALAVAGEGHPGGLVFIAAEIEDTNRCKPCADIDGTRFASYAAAYEAYPNGRYIGCLGRDRCRGHLYVIVDEPRRVVAHLRGRHDQQTHGNDHAGAAKKTDTIVEMTFKLGAATIRAAFHPGDEVTLFDDVNGRSTRFTGVMLDNRGGRRNSNRSLRSALFDVIDMPVGRRTSHFSDWGIKKIAEATPDTPGWDPDDENWGLDVIALHLALPEGEDVGDEKENLFRGPGLRMTVDQALNLIENKVGPTMPRTVRSDMGDSQVDIFPEGREIVIRQLVDGVPDWRLPIRDYRKLAKAASAVYDFDEEADDVLTQSRDVDTAIGAFTVQAWRDANDNVTKFSIQPHWQDVELSVSGEHVLDLLLDLDRPIE